MAHRWTLGAAWLCACLAVLGHCNFARGAEPASGIDIAWRAPSGCPDEGWARAAIEGYLGHRDVDAFKPMAVRVEITRTSGGRFHAELVLGGSALGDRQFEGTTCARVADAAVLIVALMLDPVEVATQIDTPRTDSRASAPRASERDGRRANGADEVMTVVLAAFAVGDVGSLPEPSIGAGLVGGVRFGRTTLAADVAAWVPRRALGGPSAASGGEIGLTTASVRGCFLAVRSLPIDLGLEPCLRVEGGVATGQGFGIAEPASSRDPWAAAFAGLSIRQLSGAPLGAWLTIEAGVPFVRPNFLIEGFGTVFHAGSLIGRASLGLAWSFP